jgi:hypothetical protein
MGAGGVSVELDGMAEAKVSGATLGVTGRSTGPLVIALRPQQPLADGSETGSWQLCVQQATARSSAAATPGFT